jgi:hypothetical protein
MNDGDDKDNDNTKSNDNDNGNDDQQDKSSKNDGNNNDNNDKSETNPNDNDPCDYHGQNICDDNGDCDNDNFDCLTDLPNGDYCTTGMCPGDDKKNNDDNKNNNNNKDSSSDSNSKSNDANSNVKKFNVKVILDDTANAEAQKFQMRVFVYGPHTLNKPTLDKPGEIVDISSCGSSCYTEWDFTASKVPLDSEIKACVWNQESGHQNCGIGKASSNYGPETIHIRLPSSISTEPFLNNNNLSNNPTTVTEHNLAKFLWGAAKS